MKKALPSRKRSRQTTFKTRLAAYSTTASAAYLAAGGAAALAVTPNMEAAITTLSNPNIVVDFRNATLLEVPFTMGPFKLLFRGSNSPGTFGLALFQPVSGGALIAGNGNTAYKLSLGNAIGPIFIPGGDLATHTTSGGTNGQFLPTPTQASVTGYIGLKAGTASTAKLGWMKIRIMKSIGDMPVGFSVIAMNGHASVFGAWDLVSDAGTDGFVVGSIPEPSTTALGGLALLALGAAGVCEMRKRRKGQTATA